MIIKSISKNYFVHFEENGDFLNFLSKEGNSFWVIDRIVYNLYKDSLLCCIKESQLFLVDALEENKVMDTVLKICERMTEIPAKRNVQLISVGGGIIQDITGVVSNILYRGIKWTFIPTTLLAACDSCIGGKTSLNYKNYKNLLGTFYPPNDIYIYSVFFNTLTEKDFESGLGEVVKFNILQGMSGVSRMESSITALKERNINKIDEAVKSSLLFKKKYIEEDEFDRGIRMHLNYAHTFGHAFETISLYRIPHGTAVAMGVVVANHISVERKILDTSIQKKIEDLLKHIIHINLNLITADIEQIISAVKKDKKQTGNTLTAVLIDSSFMLHIVHDVERKEIENGILHLFGFLQPEKDIER